jgi:hypothetical protein
MSAMATPPAITTATMARTMSSVLLLLLLLLSPMSPACCDGSASVDGTELCVGAEVVVVVGGGCEATCCWARVRYDFA